MTSKEERNGDSRDTDTGSKDEEVELHYGYRDLYPEPLDPTDTDGSKSKAKGIFDPYWTPTASEPFDVDEFIASIRRGRKVLRKIE